MSINDASIREALATVIDPALGHDITTYRILRGFEISGDDVLVKVDIPTHAYPAILQRELGNRIETALKAIGAKRVTVIPEVVTAFLPMPSDKSILKGPKNVIAVAAGKGGVGKS
ncbi:MAG: iron-sulfur cluster assembly protein, partial [Kofleriaceae bacterium]